MDKVKIILEKGYQSFSIKPLNIDFVDFLNIVHPILKKLSTYRLIKDPITKKYHTEIEKLFYLTDFRENKLILINTYLDTFLTQYGNRFDIEIKEPEDYIVKNIKLKINSKYKPREYQKLYIDAIVKNKVPRILVDLYTGYGKSLIATISSVRRGKRFGFLILPRYINKWLDDLKEYTNIKDENIFIVKGSDSIRYLSEASDKELSKIEVFIFSLTTMREYMKSYLDINEEFNYTLKPSEFIRHLKIESIVSDETHQEFHNIYALFKMLDPKFALALTATLVSDNKREADMQKLLFPEHYRLSGIVEYSKYIELYPVSYRLANPKSIKAENKYGYNHTKFEDNIKKRKQILNNYLEMIYFTVGKFYLKYKKQGDKCLIFASTVDMCERIRDYLRTKIKDIKINKYTAEDDYSVIEESDIIISTLGSAGTALDISNLITVIQTVLVKSITANIQSLGRLRRLKNKKVRFVYLYANNIYKHNDYHKERLKIFRDRVAVTINLNYSKVI